MFIARSENVDANPKSRAAALAVRKRELEAEAARRRQKMQCAGNRATPWRQRQVDKLALLCARTAMTADEIGRALGKSPMEVRQYRVDICDVMSTAIRTRRVSMARWTVCFWGRQLLGLSSATIGLFLGMDDTSVCKAQHNYTARRRHFKAWVRARKP